MIERVRAKGLATSPLARSAWLDLMRGIAVLSVITFHAVQMAPSPLPSLALITRFGQYGVDLFFVLSGWLIGGLYWREFKAFGRVEMPRFWARRWMRTLPPYFVALAASWLAVYVTRAEPFDWEYLLFLQNYRDRIPYFLVSWSLCIEEHFYFIAPLAAIGLIKFVPIRFLGALGIAMLAASPVMRWVEWSPIPTDFGYPLTATHLRLDSLIVGFCLSYLATFQPSMLQVHAPRYAAQIIFLLLLIVGLEWIGGAARYIFWPTAIALLFGNILVAGYFRESASPSSLTSFSTGWTYLATTSYSAYLVHPLAIHVAVRASSVDIGNHAAMYWPLVISIIAVTTWVFYSLIEKPAIAVRDLWIPAKAQAKAFAAAPLAFDVTHS